VALPLASVRTELASFHRRRIEIPVGPDDLVLDVGSGDKPHWRADVLLDRYVDAEHAGQRSGSRAARISHPLFDADAAAMPFADQVFDYSICSHVLEHVLDPGAVIDELVRVSKAGYVEVPEASSAKIVDFPSHLWWVRLVDGELVFTAKTARWFDPEIAAYLERSGLEQDVADLLDSRFDHRVVSLPWQGSIPYRVEGRPSEELVAAAMASGGHQRVGQTLAVRAVTAAAVLPRRGQRRRSPVHFDDVVRPELRRGTGEVLERRVYRLDAPPASSPSSDPQ
jgi:SAM-dependent methyltransferase